MTGFEASSLSPEKRALLERLLRERGLAAAGRDAIQPRPAGRPARLSHLQEGLWFLDRLDPGKATYNIPCATRMAGPLDVRALERALAEIVRRHEALRTRFPARDGVPVQEPGAAPEPLLPQRDLSALPPAEREAEALRLATEEARRPFDLANGPVFRALLLRLGERDHALVIGIHHIVSDGWSMGVFTRELFALYEAFARGAPSPLRELPIQFADFAVWQRARLQGAELERLLAFWRERLSGVEELRLPLDQARPAVPSGRGAHHSFALPAELTAALRALARAEEVTPFVLLLAAFEALLHSFSGQEDVVLGSPVACRTKSELEPLIGYFVNVLPFRTDLSGNPTFRELLARVDETVEAVHAHQDVPFAKLVEELRPARVGGNPVYQVEFTLLTPEHAPAVYGYGFRSAVDEVHRLGELTLSPMKVESGVSKFDLVVLLWDAPAGIQGTFEYDADLFLPATVERMARRFEAVLAFLRGRPEARLSEVREHVAAREPAPAPRRPAGPRGARRRSVGSSSVEGKEGGGEGRGTA